MPQQSTRTRLSHLPLTLLCTLAVAACAGSSGSNGATGATGATGGSGSAGASATCTAKSNGDGTSTITCSDGTSATVSNGAGGPTGPTGGSGAPGTSCTVVDNGNGTRTIACGAGTSVTVSNAVVDYSQMNAAEQADSNPAAVITAVSVPADGRPVVTLKVSDRKGNGIQKLSLVAIAPNVPVSWRFALLQLVPGGTTGVNASAADTWVSYNATNATSTASTESANVDPTKGGTLTDNADGTYSYRFLKVVNGAAGTAGITYAAAATHRLVVLLSASGNPFAPINIVKDFVPSTGADVSKQNDKVDPASCLTCHTRFRAIAGSTAGFHSGQRYDVDGCVACHNDQRRFTAVPGTGSTPAANDASIAADGTWTGNLAVLNGEAIDNLPVFIHKIHMGEGLKMTGGNYTALQFPTYTYPQDVTNCVKCHAAPAAAKAADYLTASRRACGACHDNVSFAATTPPGRVVHAASAGGIPLADDSTCATCHGATKFKDVAAVHTPVAPPDPNSTWATGNAAGSNSNTNAAYLANAGVVPAGATKFTYVVKSVSRNASKQPVITFKLQSAIGAAAATDVVFNTYATATDNLLNNFVGSPTVYFAWSVPQDGIATPADFNVSASGYVKRIWNGTATGTAAGTMTGPDATTGLYTITLTGVSVADNATMLTGGVGYAYGLGTSSASTSTSQPLTQTNLPAYPISATNGTGGLIVPAANVAVVGTGYAARRAIVSNDKCNTCHAALGATPTFHAGQRNDGPTCAFCHKPNQASNGWSTNSNHFIHGIHGASQRANPYLWHAVSPTQTYGDVTYPAVLSDCEMCHLPGTYDYSAKASAAAVPFLNPITVQTGTIAIGTVAAPVPFNTNPLILNDPNYKAGVTAGTPYNYGAGFSYSAATGVASEAAPTTMVMSPIVSACSACHDSPLVIDHMQANGGVYYEPRGPQPVQNKEQCLLCHGAGTVASIYDVHMSK